MKSTEIAWSNDLDRCKCGGARYIKLGKIEYSICSLCGDKRKAVGPFVVIKKAVTK